MKGGGHASRIWTVKPGPKVRPFDDRFIPEPNTGCWLWTGQVAKGGYGRISVYKMRVPMLAHRKSWELHRGPVPDGMLVLHRCDTPACVNPDHLFVGTPLDNVRDMISKGRADLRGRPRRSHGGSVR